LRYCRDVDELALNDKRLSSPKTGTKEWRAAEWVRYREALTKFDGVFPPFMAGLQLGVSRQRVFTMIETGILERLEFFGHVFVRGDEIDALVAMESERRKPGFRWSQAT